MIKTCSKALGFTGSGTQPLRLTTESSPIFLKFFFFLSVTKELHSAHGGQRAAVINAHH